VRRLYKLINEGRWEEVWLSYSPEFRDTCRYQSFVADHSPFFRGRVAKVVDFENVDIYGKRASASFSVSVTGGPDEEYEYFLILVEDGGKWYWEESC
jgi:hypothetical protein